MPFFKYLLNPESFEGDFKLCIKTHRTIFFTILIFSLVVIGFYALSPFAEILFPRNQSGWSNILVLLMSVLPWLYFTAMGLASPFIYKEDAQRIKSVFIHKKKSLLFDQISNVITFSLIGLLINLFIGQGLLVVTKYDLGLGYVLIPFIYAFFNALFGKMVSAATVIIMVALKPPPIPEKTY